MSTAAPPSSLFQWSVLPPLQLRGVGTSLVESAEHYAIRLAWTAGTTIRQICHMSAPFSELSSHSVGGVSRFCGPGDVYKKRIHVLESLTGVDTIRCGTLMVLDRILWSWVRGPLARLRTWCPECYSAWDDEASYEPLIWQSAVLSHCVVHGCKLQCECHACGRGQPYLVPYQVRRQCAFCTKRLINPSVSEYVGGMSLWRQRQLEGLIEMCATPGEPPVSDTALKSFVQMIPIERLRKNRVSWVIKDAIGELRSANKASLESIICLCAIHGVSAKDILRDPEGTASMPLLDNWEEEHLLTLLETRIKDQ